MTRYSFDLDGTLCETDGTDYANARPLWDRIRQVRLLIDAGHDVFIQTARGMGPDNRRVPSDDVKKLIRTQLAEWGLRDVRAWTKPAADVYVDDRGISADEFFGGER